MKSLRGWGAVFFMIVVVSVAGCSKPKSTDTQPRNVSPAQVKTPPQNAPSNFNWKVYVNNYQDLRDAGIDTEDEALEHWLNFGKKEGRDYQHALTPFAQAALDENVYASSADSKEAREKPKVSSSAKAEGALPPDFDWETYVANYGDLQGITTKEAAAKHWLKTGKKEGRTYKNLW